MDHKFLFFKEADILERASYEYFKKNKKFTNKVYDEHLKWLRIATGLITAMNQLWNESDGGLYLKDIGYFTYLPKYKVRGRRISLVRRKKDRFHYEKCFIPFCKELLPFRSEGTYRTDKIITLDLAKINNADEFEKQSKYLRGRMRFLQATKYMSI